MANEVVINVKANTDRANKGLDGMRATMKKVGAAATIAGVAIVGLGAASLKSFATAGDEVHKMSIRTGFSTKALSEFRLAAELSGTSLKAMETGVRRMQMSLVDAERGVKLSVDAFDSLGISVEDIKNLSPEQQFETLTMALAGLEDPALRTKTAMDLFGRAGTAILPMLADGEEGLEAMKQQAHDLGLVFDEEAAAKAARLNDAMTTMKGSMSGVMMVIAEKLAPVVTKIAIKIEQVVSRVTAWADENPRLTQLIVMVTMAIGGLLTIVGPLLIAIGLIGTVIGAVVSPIGLVVVAIIALAVAWQRNMFGIRDVTAKIWSNIRNFIAKSINSIVDKVNWLIDNLNRLNPFEAQIPSVEAMAESIMDLGSKVKDTVVDFMELEKAASGAVEDRSRLGGGGGGGLGGAIPAVLPAVSLPSVGGQEGAGTGFGGGGGGGGGGGAIAGAMGESTRFRAGLDFIMAQNQMITSGQQAATGAQTAQAMYWINRDVKMDNFGNVVLEAGGHEINTVVDLFEE